MFKGLRITLEVKLRSSRDHIRNRVQDIAIWKFDGGDGKRDLDARYQDLGSVGLNWEWWRRD